MTRFARTPLPDSSRPWGRGSSRQWEEKAPEEIREGVVGVAGVRDATGETSGEIRVDW